MLRTLDEGLWAAESGRPGPALAVSFGVHGNERPPIEAGTRLVELFASNRLELAGGRLLLIHANTRASAQGRRWSAGGVDLNRCFRAPVLEGQPRLYEEGRARVLVDALEAAGAEILVDFHCTVEPGPGFLMQHPPADDEDHRRVSSLLAAEVLLTDPELRFGGVSFDEWMSAHGKVGICYETGWIGDPANSPERVLDEMTNLLAGLGLLSGGEVRTRARKRCLRLAGLLACEAAGFTWRPGMGENLQALAAGTVLGSYPDGKELVLEQAATLIFPKKRPELVQPGKPLAYLAR